MEPGAASVTAQRVAAHRLTFDRVAAEYGDPAADEMLSRDVASAAGPGGEGPMVRYLAGRTRFFDRAVTSAIGGGLTQIVLAGAGYDGRALRYARSGVRWFELDHPATQRDKQARLARLEIDTGTITFAPADFTRDHAGEALLAAGFDPARPALFCCEGVAVYLEEPVLRALLAGLAAVAAPGSRLAISVSVTGPDDLAERRARFQEVVAAAGEPARSTVTADDAGELLAATGWREIATGDPDDRARRAGFVQAERAAD